MSACRYQLDYQELTSIWSPYEGISIDYGRLECYKIVYPTKCSKERDFAHGQWQCTDYFGT